MATCSASTSHHNKLPEEVGPPALREFTVFQRKSCNAACNDDNNNNQEIIDDNFINRNRTKNRNSFHQDVNEALNSLLWQPYEYRKDYNALNVNGDLATARNNERYGNEAEDLHLYEMVNNPTRNQLGGRCYEEESKSREQLANPNRLLATDVSLKERAGVCVSCSCGVDNNSNNYCDWNEIINMRVEISANSCDNNNPLINANVVGLPFPNHVRNSSEPCNNSAVQPVTINHTRNTSTPAHTNINSPVNCANIVSILSHHRHSSHLSPNDNAANFNTPRSASVPKTETYANFYRAVPVTVLSNVTTVPTIQCDLGNNVSNVNIVQAMPPPPTTNNTSTVSVINEAPVAAPQTTPGVRTFTSTEAQTEDTTTVLVRNTERALSREQRRRERRERRHQRRLNNVNHLHQNERLPDLLSNHMPPPYSPPNALLPVPSINPTVLPNSVVVPFPPPVIPGGQVPLVQNGASVGVATVPIAPTSGFRIPFPSPGFRRYSLRSRYSEDHPKSCCAFLIWKPGSLRWFIALIAVVAVCCVLVGTALGAMRPAGRDHLTVSLLMIGVGIVLVTVSGIAWKLTSHDSSTCRGMLGLGSTESVDTCPRRFIPRLPPSYGRPHHPYAAMIYPEFQYRPPPPSYQASMQEYRLRLLLLDRANNQPTQNGPSPPPTYRSYAGSLLRAPLSNGRNTNHSEYSFPPSYRSHTSTLRPATITSAIIHTRERSLTLSDSHHSTHSNNHANNNDIALDNITIDSLKLVPEVDITPVKMLLKGSSCSDFDGIKDGNLVTIVQTSDQSPVIVTVSGCSQTEGGSTVQITDLPSEMEILAHL